MGDPNVSERNDKPWDYPWTTEEMRQKRREWSLAADAGLLKHLENFHNNITKKAKQTEEDLSSLTNQLNQTTILVENVTNTSLALANNQFVESRVQEDDVEISKPAPNDVQENKDHELSASELIASVSETILKGLQIMDEKYEKVEVVASDSEDEAENTLPSVILKPKDPYQDRPLPYIIGSEKWKNSSKIGLEFSSSEDSEQEEEEEEENDSSDSEGAISKAPESVVPKMMIHKQISSSLSGSDDFEVEREKVGEVYNATEPSTESITPSSLLPKNQMNGPPSFAEELAKRLGNVLPQQKVKDGPVANKAEDEAESLFPPESEQEPVMPDRKTDNLFSESANLFDEDWNEERQRPSRSEAYASKVKNNFIPVSNDLPPPMNDVSTKPKLAIDDLFGDADSDDSDDIFTSKPLKKSGEPLKIPEKEILFDDDDEHLFSNTKTTPTKEPVKKIPPGGVSIFGNVDVISSGLAGKFPGLQRHQSTSSDDDDFTSDTPTPVKRNETNDNKPEPTFGPNKTETDGNKASMPSMEKKMEPPFTDRSDIFSKPAVPHLIEPSTLRAQPHQMTPEKSNDGLVTESDSRKHESIFDDDEDDLFGPPPLPKAAASQKQKVTSLFDDSDSDNELFSTTSHHQPNKNRIFDDDDDLFGDVLAVTKKDTTVSNNDFEQVPDIKQEKKKVHSIFDDSDDEEDDDLFSKPKASIFAGEEILSLPKAAAPPINTPLETEPDTKMDGEAQPKPEETVTDGAVASKKAPPATLGIRVLPGLPAEGGLPKRPVSGKIKDLMGKMGSLKILSPTDTPPVLRKEKEESDEDGSVSLPSTSPLNSDEPSNKKSPSVLKRENSEENAESAVSFDEPVKSEALSSASKNRARLPAKRRPQSRQARQSALRHSGIDFDVADAPRLVEPDRENSENTISDRLTVPSAKSSTNKNTLRSPSTDEEDLFDVPPDLPEDTLKEDPLFGRAPILSPSDSLEEKDEPDGQDRNENKSDEDKEEEILEKEEPAEKNEVTKDPLRDESHDPLQDPSQLFAFVTRTLSPEKTKIVFNDDDSLFSSKSQKDPPKAVSAQSSIFDDDDDSDLFSKPVKRPLLVKKVSLFDDDEDDDNEDLFGLSKVSSQKDGQEKTKEKKEEKKRESSVIFDDDDDDVVFNIKKDGVKKREMTGSNLKDIFGDQSSGDEDLFSASKSGARSKKVEEEDVFASKKVKDLRKTAEKISKDPLSLLQDD